MRTVNVRPSKSQRQRRDPDDRLVQEERREPEGEADQRPAGEARQGAAAPGGVAEGRKAEERGGAEEGGGLVRGQVAGGAAVGGAHGGERHAEEAAEEDHVREVAVDEQVGGGPERQREKERVAGDGGEPRVGRIEAGGAAAAEGEGLRHPEAAGGEDEGQRHGEVRDPALPGELRPELDVGRGSGGGDHPGEEQEREKAVGGEIAAAAEAGDQRLAPAGGGGQIVRAGEDGERQREGKPAHRVASASAISRRRWRAKAQVAGSPSSAPPRTARPGVSTGSPSQLRTSERKKRFTAAAPAAKG